MDRADATDQGTGCRACVPVRAPEAASYRGAVGCDRLMIDVL
jgi:hypothetical protein